MPIPDSEVTQGRASDEPVFTPPPSMARSASDWATSFIRGLAKGTEGMVGLPGDAVEALSHGSKVASDYISDKIGIDKGPEPSKFNLLPTSEGINKAIGGDEMRRNTVGKFLDKEPETTGGKYAQSVGEFVPGVVGGPGGLVRKGIQAVAGGVGSEAAGEAAKSIAPDHETAARVLGGITGQGLPGVIRKAIAPSNIRPEREAMVAALRNEGVEPTAGDVTGNKRLKYAEHSLGEAPGSGGAHEHTRQEVKENFTRAAMQRVGVNELATPEVVDHVFTTTGHQFDDLAARNNAQLDPQYFARITQAQHDYDHLFVDPLTSPQVQNVIDHAFNQLQRSGTMTGEQYQALRSRLERMRRRAAKNDPELADFLSEVRDSTDDLMERSIQANNPQDLGAWQENRRRYRNLLVIEKAATGAGTDAADGIISPAKLRQALVSQSRRQYARGQGDFADLARAGESVLKPPPTSGTSERAFLHALAGGALHPMTWASLLAPGASGRALMSGPAQAYLKNELAHSLGVDVHYLDSLRPGVLDKLIRSALAEHGRSSTQSEPITVEGE